MQPESASRIDVLITMIDAQMLLGKLLDSFATLTVCRSGGRALLAAMDSSKSKLVKEKLDKPLEMEERYDIQQVINKAKEFQAVLSAELQTLATYHATQKGIYATPDLIEHAENILPESIRRKLGPDVVEEIRQSGRCLAFDNATASGFHRMRATEAVLHEYYVAVCKPQSRDKLQNWGAYLAKLRDIKQPDVEKV